MSVPDLADVVRSVGLAHGLDAVGIAPPEPFERARAVLEERKRAGLHGSMQFTYRNPARSTDASVTLPSVRAIVVGARSYRRERPPAPADRGPVGRVADYMCGDDYEALARGLQAIADVLHDAGHRTCVVADQNHLVDREAAYRAGLGWYGKNANVLLPGHGSWFVLGSVLTDAPVPHATTTVADGCGSCERCLHACPTGAIVAPGVVDARRCLSWSLQATGPFPREQRVALGDRIYGCDDCQDVCPPNRREHRVGPAVTSAPDQAWIPMLELLDTADPALLARFGRWYLPNREVRYLRRNALVVLGNVGDAADPRVVDALTRYLRDADPMLRAHAAWAARRLGRTDLLAPLADDPAPEVREELAADAPPVRAA
ncbi:MAG: tRNA epoxyqueuosine(34) reductase QueG [Acidimicrobiales bacterium]|nr:tRNA epoxyqueuosine(34) reductase QueG [Acidimicrobiales bacterium]